MIERIGESTGALTGGKLSGARPKGREEGFGQVLNDFLKDTNQIQLKADEAAVKLASGEPVSLQEVMIDQKEAQLSLQLFLQIRNKLVQAYKEIMRLPM